MYLVIEAHEFNTKHPVILYLNSDDSFIIETYNQNHSELKVAGNQVYLNESLEEMQNKIMQGLLKIFDKVDGNENA